MSKSFSESHSSHGGGDTGHNEGAGDIKLEFYGFGLPGVERYGILSLAWVRGKAGLNTECRGKLERACCAFLSKTNNGGLMEIASIGLKPCVDSVKCAVSCSKTLVETVRSITIDRASYTTSFIFNHLGLRGVTVCCNAIKVDILAIVGGTN